MQALCRIGDLQAVGPLIGALDDQNQWIRRSAAEGLGLIGDERAIEPLVAALDDDSPYVRTVAAKALESIRGSAVPEEGTHTSDKRQANTIIGRLIGFKIYAGAGIGVLLLLGGLTIAFVGRRRRVAEWGRPHHH